MKYPVYNCPNCGCGDAEKNENGDGLIPCFHAQDQTKGKLPGTIMYIRCSKCGYVGPIVLCERGFSAKKVADAWNEHIKPGSSLSTSDLVRELEGRKGVECMAAISKKDMFTGKIDDLERDIGYVIPGSYGHIVGPATILVVRGVR